MFLRALISLAALTACNLVSVGQPRGHLNSSPEAETGFVKMEPAAAGSGIGIERQPTPSSRREDGVLGGPAKVAQSFEAQAGPREDAAASVEPAAKADPADVGSREFERPEEG
jgi:hypothetical protein